MKTNVRNALIPRAFSLTRTTRIPCVVLAAISLLPLLFVAHEAAIAAGPTNLSWVKTFDAPRGLVIGDIAADSAGNVYLSGHFWGRAVVGNVKLASEGEADIFVAKMKSDGEFIWVAHTGTTWSETAERIGVDASGNSYVYGKQTRPSDNAMGFFIVKYDPQGNQLWMNQVVKSLADQSYYDGLPVYDVPLLFEGYFFAVDGIGNSFLIAPGNPGQVLSFGPDGIRRWSTPLGDRGGVITAVDGIAGRKDGGVVVAGSFRDTVKIGGKTLIPGKEADFFVLCLDASGSVAWVEQSESRSKSRARGLTLGGNDSVLVFVNLWGETTVGDRTLKWEAGEAPQAGKPALVEYDRNGKVLWAVGLTGKLPWQFALADLQMDATENTLALMSTGGSSVAGSLVSFAPDGHLMWDLPQALKPHSMAIDSHGGLFLTTTRSDPDGHWLSQLLKVEARAQQGSPPGGPSAPMGNAPSPVVPLVCPTGKLGEFRHGTKCVGYYDTAQPDGKLTLVDIQVAGKASSKAYTKTKSLVHAGVDIVAPEGSEIRPVADGTVDDVIVSPNDENFGSLGYMVIIEHSQKFGGKPVYSLYLHMKEKPKVTVGQSVKAGETVLGLVGSTGAAFGPHVHFELRRFAGRFFPKWKNIYGIEHPTEEATFDPAEFAENWLDPETFRASGSAPPGGASGASTGAPGAAQQGSGVAMVAPSAPSQSAAMPSAPAPETAAKSKPKVKPTFQEFTAGIKDGDQFQTYNQDFAYAYDRVWNAALARISKSYQAGEYETDQEQGTILTKSKKFISDGSFDGYLYSRYALLLERLTDTSTRVTIKRWTYAETKPGEIHVINSWMLSGGSKGVLKDIGKAAEKAGKGR